MSNPVERTQANPSGETIAASVARERRSALQVGGEADYAEAARGVRLLLIGVVALVVVLIGLSLVVTIEEVARARGEFIPVQRVQVIQTPEGGAIEAILVRNDEQVAKGQTIARFRATELVRDVQQADIRAAYLQINIERLGAFADGRIPNFARFRADYPLMVAEASKLSEEHARALVRGFDQKDREIEEERSALNAAQNEIPAAKSSFGATQALLQRTREGVETGVIALNRLAQVEEQAAQSERIHTQLVASLDQHATRIKRLEAERAAILAKSAVDARTQRSDLVAQLDELKATQSAYASRSGDIEVKAPVNGIVQKISETPIGTVIPPGGTVFEIVPTDGGVLIEARVSPRDIGFVRIGQKALVKSDAFDYGRFGSIPGRVARIAASNTQDGPGQAPYIRVEIELDQPYVGTDQAHVVKPGMTGEATILTGEKSIFQYLLKPIYLTLDTALRER